MYWSLKIKGICTLFHLLCSIPCSPLVSPCCYFNLLEIFGPVETRRWGPTPWELWASQKRVNVPFTDRVEVRRDLKFRRTALDQSLSNLSLQNSPLGSLFQNSDFVAKSSWCGLEICTCHIPVDSGWSGPWRPLVETLPLTDGAEGNVCLSLGLTHLGLEFQTSGPLEGFPDVKRVSLSYREPAQHWVGTIPAKQERTVHYKPEWLVEC